MKRSHTHHCGGDVSVWRDEQSDSGTGRHLAVDWVNWGELASTRVQYQIELKLLEQFKLFIEAPQVIGAYLLIKVMLIKDKVGFYFPVLWS